MTSKQAQPLESPRIEGVVLEPEEEAEILRREAEIPELDRQGLLRPMSDYLADSRAARSTQRRVG